MDGWIKSYRKMFDNPIVCKDSDHLAVWVYLLHYAAHEEHDFLFNGQRITVKQGQIITSRKTLSDKLHINESKVQRILKTFENEQQIEQRTDRQKRLITLLNWDKYQKGEQPFEQRVNNDRTTSEQRVNTYKNVKNDKNVKNEIIIPPKSPQGEEWVFDKHSNVENGEHIIGATDYKFSDDIQMDSNLRTAIKAWLEYKDERKPRTHNHYTESGLKALLNKFALASKEFGCSEVVRVVEDSIANNYQGIVWDKMRKEDKPSKDRMRDW